MQMRNMPPALRQRLGFHDPVYDAPADVQTLEPVATPNSTVPLLLLALVVYFLIFSED